MKKRTRIVLWLLLLVSNDIEINPGPGTEMALQSLQKEVRELSRVLQIQRENIADLTGFQGKVKLEEEVIRLSKDLEAMKERIHLHGSLVSQNKNVSSAMDYELSALKKLSSQNRNELKNFGALMSSDLRNMKEELGKNVLAIRQEHEDNKEFKREFLKLSRVFREMTDDQRSMVELLRKDFLALRDFNRSQLNGLKTVMDKVSREIVDMQREAQVFRTEIQGLNGLIRNLSSESDQHRSLINQTKRVTESLISQKGNRPESLDEMENQYNELSKKLSNHSDSIVANSKTIKNVNDHMSAVIQQAMEETASSIDKTHQKIEDNSNTFEESLSSLKSEMNDLHDITHRNIKVLSDEASNSIQDLNNKTSRISRNLCDRMDEIDLMHDDMQDRVFEIDKNRKNNLVFFGLKGEESDSDDSERLVKGFLNGYLRVTREIPITKVLRLWNGPTFRGVKPVLVCFQLFKDKEEILRKSSTLLKGTNVYVTEDFSRKIRKQREELLKFARDLRSRDPEVKVNLVYDRLYVENEVYLFNEIEAKVERVQMKIIDSKKRPMGSNHILDEPMENHSGETSNDHHALRRQRLDSKYSSSSDYSRSTERIEIEIFPFHGNQGRHREPSENAVLPSIENTGRGSLTRMASMELNTKSSLPTISN